MSDSVLEAAPAATTAPDTSDLLVVGAGPTGLACAIEAQKAGFRVVLVDKGCICNSLFHYPAHMTFFTTPELLEIGDIPFPSPNPKPTRNEALQYYRLVAAHYKLDVRQYHRVERIAGSDGAFTVHIVDRFNRPSTLRSRKLALSTGYYDLPNLMGIPGENLSKVHHYYVDPHPYFEMDVVVIGGKNSAAIAALELWRSGARVTLVHRGPGIQPQVKYWIKPDIENRIKCGEIKAYFDSNVVEVTPDTVLVRTPQGSITLKNDFVFAMTGYHLDFGFLEALGIRFEGPDRLPVCDP
jgi:thioredoxin reductase (NADPH)